ncbi:MAG: DUF559 domain-containing protein [Gammaproteobacteria bacterium]
MDGVKFRRQQVLGPYVVDCLCLEPRLSSRSMVAGGRGS